MRCIVYIILVATGLAVLAACNPQPEAPKLLAEAERLMENNPDSAMRLIDSLFYPEKSLSREQYMRYLVTRVQARYKNHRDIVEDTLVFDAARYFTRHDNDPRQTALAWFYSGCIYREQKNYEQAMRHYKEAETYAGKANDTDLRGLIQYNMGDLLAEQGLRKEALDSYRNAEHLYRRQPDKRAQCLSAVGRMYTFLQQSDSAFLYFLEGLEIAETAGNRRLQSLLAQNLSIVYRENKQYDEAEVYLRRSYQLNNDSAKRPRYYLNFARLYAGMDRQDSAALYTVKLKQNIDSLDNTAFKASAYSYLADWEKRQANYDAAFSYQTERMKVLTRMMEERGNRSVYETQRKYDYEHMQKQYYRNQSVRLQWIIALLGMLIVGGALFTWYWVRQRNRQAEIQRNMDTLKEMNRDLESAVHRKQLDLRKDLLWRFDVARKAVEINKEINRPGKPDTEYWIGQFNKIIYGEKSIEEQWDAMLQTFNAARPGLSERIREKYPDLTETEFRVCILTYAGFRIKEIALILNQKPNTIQTRRTNIRRKMGIDPGSNIPYYIDQIFG